MHRILINPQMERVHVIEDRLHTAQKYAAQRDTAHIGRDLVKVIRRDILVQKPHRLYTQLPLRAHYEPVLTLRDWREKIAAILVLARTTEAHTRRGDTQ